MQSLAPNGTEGNGTTTAELRPDADALADFWRDHVYPGDVHEVRIPKSRKGPRRFFGAVSGYFKTEKAFVDEVSRITGADGQAVYITLNPVAPALLARANNRLQDRAETATADADVVRRARLLIDLDPVRPTGISSTDAERDAALARRDDVRAFLDDLGWPMPTIVMMTGNGGALVYRIDLPNDAAATALVTHVLRALAHHFDTPTVVVDTTVYNAARIMKVGGTVAAKGDATADRPHRIATADYPYDPKTIEPGPVPVDRLEAVAALAPVAEPRPVSSNGHRARRDWDVRDLLRHAGVGWTEQPKGYGVALSLDRCLTSDDHTDGAYIIEFPSGALAYGCHHNRCADKTWNDVRPLLGLPARDTALPPPPTEHRASNGTLPSSSAAAGDGLHETDLGNARRLVRDHGTDLRFCHRLRKWFVWDGMRWETDDSGAVLRRAKQTVATMYAEASAIDDETARKALAKHALKSEGEARIKAMVALAESEEGIPISPDDLDRDPWLLNAPNATIDLRTGTLRPHDRDDLITKLVPVRYDPNAACPRFLAFLGRIMDGNARLIGFLQRAIGYSLSGITSERAIFIPYGIGRNGKSTLLEVVRATLGDDYAMRTPTDTLLAKRTEGIPNDVARLRGARFVTASEAEEGRRLAEAKIKDLTGGDTVSARFMRGEFFDFRPEFKAWLSTNHKPTIKGTDEGIWDRIKLIPFAVRIPDHEQDKHLRDRLLAEAPGILAWAVRGCLDWQRDGLGVPEEVRAATADYRNEMDVLGAFLDDRCVAHPNASVTAKALYAAYVSWCEETGEKAVSQKAVGQRLAERGFDAARAGKDRVRTWVGLGLLGDGQPDPKADAFDKADACGRDFRHNRASTESREFIPKNASKRVRQENASALDDGMVEGGEE